MYIWNMAASSFELMKLDIFGIFYEIAPRWVPQDLTDD